MDQFRHFLAGVDKHQYFMKSNKTHSRNTLVDVLINITWLNELITLKLLSQSDKRSLLLAAIR